MSPIRPLFKGTGRVAVLSWSAVGASSGGGLGGAVGAFINEDAGAGVGPSAGVCVGTGVGIGIDGSRRRWAKVSMGTGSTSRSGGFLSPEITTHGVDIERRAGPFPGGAEHAAGAPLPVTVVPPASRASCHRGNDDET